LPKSLLFLFILLILTMVSLKYVHDTQDVVGWFGVSLFGIGALLILLNIVFNRPPLRFTTDGVTYKGSYGLWMRGQASWKDIRAIVLAPLGAERRGLPFGGCYDLNVFIEGERPRRVTIQNWQLPTSTRKTLQAVIERFHQQIAENKIVVRGVE
jgi:hypothetical protein